MPITVNKLYLVNISAFGFSDILSHSLFQYAVSSYSKILNYLDNLHLFSISPSFRIQGLGTAITALHLNHFSTT